MRVSAAGVYLVLVLVGGGLYRSNVWNVIYDLFSGYAIFDIGYNLYQSWRIPFVKGK